MTLEQRMVADARRRARFLNRLGRKWQRLVQIYGSSDAAFDALGLPKTSRPETLSMPRITYTKGEPK
jgi:hypothetical protein